MSYLEFQEVSFRYTRDSERQEILTNFNLQVEKGEFLVLIGPSGCGQNFDRRPDSDGAEHRQIHCFSA